MTETTKAPSRKEQILAGENIERIARITERHRSSSEPVEIEIGGESGPIRIPVSALRSLTAILRHMAEGRAVSVIPAETELSTQQAADLLNVSRPHVVKLLETGEIPFNKVGTHRRITLQDLERFKSKLARQRARSLTELAKQAQELKMGY